MNMNIQKHKHVYKHEFIINDLLRNLGNLPQIEAEIQKMLETPPRNLFPIFMGILATPPKKKVTPP